MNLEFGWVDVQKRKAGGVPAVGPVPEVAGINPGHTLPLFASGDVGVTKKDGINFVAYELRV